MVVTIHAQHLAVTPAIKAFVAEHLQEPIERLWRGQDAELDIFLRDTRGGDKQGLDKECRCVFYMPRGRRFVITEVTEDIRRSIQQSRARLMRRMRQYVERRVNGTRRERKHHFADVANGSLRERSAAIH
jgi:ribosome-associated translation inhibitor RaiA